MSVGGGVFVCFCVFLCVFVCFCVSLCLFMTQNNHGTSPFIHLVGFKGSFLFKWVLPYLDGIVPYLKMLYPYLNLQIA